MGTVNRQLGEKVLRKIETSSRLRQFGKKDTSYQGDSSLRGDLSYLKSGIKLIPKMLKAKAKSKRAKQARKLNR